jgi:glutathione synthase/RimK-type ligase-like ATP-grasp enzyme
MILAISYPGEEHTDRVVGLLERQGREVVRLDLAEFPARGLALSWSGSAEADGYWVDAPGGRVNLAEAAVGWWRRVQPFTVDPAIRSEHDRAFVRSETSQAINGTLDALSCGWVNPRDADAAAHHKPYQWAVARSLGLPLPRTLVTNKPEDARAFIDAIGVGKVVFKAFLASVEQWRETRTVEAADVAQLELVRYAPVVFQEYIEGVDLRVTIVGEQVFAAEIDARATRYPVDMRMVVGESTVRPATLDASLQERLLALQRRLHLVYGAIDLKRTPSGEYYFLEVNPAGQWLFAEQLAGLPITQAMADYLAMREDAHRVAAA